MSDLVQKIASAVIKVARPITAEEANELHEAIRGVLARQERGEAVAFACHIDLEEGMEPDACVLDLGRPGDCVYAKKYGDAARQKCGEWKPVKFAHPTPDASPVKERGEAVALAEITEAGALEPTIQGVMSLRPGMKLYAHPTPDAGRVAELERCVKFAGESCDLAVEQLMAADARIAALGAQIAESARKLEVSGYAWSQMGEQLNALQQQLAESREREGRMRAGFAEAVDVIRSIDEYGKCKHLIAEFEAALAADKEQK